MLRAAHLARIVLRESDRHGGFDGGAHRAQVVGQVGCGQRQPHRIHPASDIHPHRRRNNGREGGNDRTDRCADACMDVRHGRNMSVHDRQLRDIDELLNGFVLDVARPDFDRNAAFVERDLNAHDRYPRKTRSPGDSPGLLEDKRLAPPDRA